MSYIASGGKTKKELADVFHFPDDKNQLLEDMANLRRQLRAAAKHKRIDLSIGNSAWLDEIYADFREEYVKEVQEVFAAAGLK